MKNLLLLVVLGLSTTLFAGFDWGSDCSSGNGTFTDSIPKSMSKVVGGIPKNRKNVIVKLNSDVDVDIRLLDADNDVEIISWPKGLLNGADEECKTYNDVEYCYSGYNGTDGNLGNEWIEIRGTTNVALTMEAFGYAEGDAEVDYSWSASTTCNEVGNGEFSQFIKNNSTVDVGVIPFGITNVMVELNAGDKDVDLQLFNEKTGEMIIGWPDGLLKGESEEEIEYGNLKIKYSGYNGIAGKFGNEKIEITGKTDVALSMKAFGYQPGKADVKYEWGVGAGTTCGTRISGSCPEGLFCKEEISGSLASDKGGVCHIRNWCFNAETAFKDCSHLPNLWEGYWTCEEFKCVAKHASKEGRTCGTRGAIPANDCGEGLFCKYEMNSQCGEVDAGGICTRTPEVCTQQYDPVCGCDGNTYSNECAAASNGASAAYAGRCGAGFGEMCGGIAGIQCVDGLSCISEETYPDAAGECKSCPMYAMAQCPEGTHAEVTTDSNGCPRPICVLDKAEEGEMCGGFAGIQCVDGLSCISEETYPDAAGECKSCPMYAMAQCPDGTHVEMTTDSIGCPRPICILDKAEEGEFCGGIAGIQCSDELMCHSTESYPDAGGICVNLKLNQGEECNQDMDCEKGLLCSNFNNNDQIVGSEYTPAAFCEPAWMLGSFSNSEVVTIDAGTSGGTTIHALNLASVGMNAILSLKVDLGFSGASEHDLTFNVIAGNTGYDTSFRTSIVDPSKVKMVGSVLEISGLPINTPGDDNVNGDWMLRITNANVQNMSVRLQSWNLDLSSRWD